MMPVVSGCRILLLYHDVVVSFCRGLLVATDLLFSKTRLVERAARWHEFSAFPQPCSLAKVGATQDWMWMWLVLSIESTSRSALAKPVGQPRLSTECRCMPSYESTYKHVRRNQELNRICISGSISLGNCISDIYRGFLKALSGIAKKKKKKRVHEGNHPATKSAQ